ncbi:alpha/beta hydrolase [Paenibacillus sp. IB182496]|uniref:Alpha/beta hydrolase n=1 Tax=Paenibacillus sabuli TaxID=2772509 RepID=A0A927BW26_9BACL|nr:alpha/beta hydrolase [Paenibacillus sabuli]MBD2846559.1 alpha/beta hydrolase [Paenibacillus sabuli]
MTLTPDRIATDFLRIADAMQVETFSYYGYSWLALIGLQLAIRTNRLESLIMGGFPPYKGPYKEMMTVTAKTNAQALDNQTVTEDRMDDPAPTEASDWDNVQVKMDPGQTKQFFKLYQHLLDFDDTAIHGQLRFPKLAFAGEKDKIVYGENFGNVTVDMFGILTANAHRLKQFGWDVVILRGDGMDHTKAMQPESVLPLIKPWLLDKLSRDSADGLR